MVKKNQNTGKKLDFPAKLFTLSVIIASMLTAVSCDNPPVDVSDQQEISLEFVIPATTGSRDIADDSNVTGAVVQVINSSGSNVGTITLSSTEDGHWSGSGSLEAEGNFNFIGIASNASSEMLYLGRANKTIPTAEVITLTSDPNSLVGTQGPGGGYIFYDKGSYSNSWRYLEAAPYGWSGGGADPAAAWGDGSTSISTATGLGDGSSNTTNIIAAFPSGSYAANLAGAYQNGYSDWFLPSTDELNQVYSNLKGNNLGGFGDTTYWSSNEIVVNNVEIINFTDQSSNYVSRTENHAIRPIRFF